MKEICIFYSPYTGKYIVNERGEKTAEDVHSENIKDSIEEAINFIKLKYQDRKIVLHADVPDEINETILKGTKIQIG